MRAQQQVEQHRTTGTAKIPRRISETRQPAVLAHPPVAARSGCACGGICPRCSSGADHAAGAVRISRPDEAHEHQADRIADRIVATPLRNGIAARPLRRPTRDVGGSLAAAPAEVRSALATPGRALDEQARSTMERRFGVDFAHVRIHVGAAPAQSARALGARAYTLGNHIVFGEGEYESSGAAGERLLAHELVHVVQQTAGGGITRGAVDWQPVTVSPMIQRDLAIEPPRPDAVPRVLTPAEMTDAIDFNNRVLSHIPNSDQVIRMIRDVVGISATPTVVDNDFVNGVLRWQAWNRLRQDGKLGPISARPLFQEIGAEHVGRGRVRSGPRYIPHGGPLAVGPAFGDPKVAQFRFEAEFDSDPANGIYPSCCEVRQYLRWNAAAAAGHQAMRGGAINTPHSGFPNNWPVNRWIEDRDSSNNRYGHRGGRHSDPGPGDQYLDNSGRQNQAFGHRYRGSDAPGGPAALAGRWEFLIKVIDVCNGNVDVGGIDRVFVDW